MSIKERLIETRKANGLSQQKFAARISVSGSYIADMELGKKPVNQRILRLISVEFGINEHWFRTGEGEMYSRKEDMALGEISGIFKGLHPQCQALALTHMRALAKLSMNQESSDSAESRE